MSSDTCGRDGGAERPRAPIVEIATAARAGIRTRVMPVGLSLSPLFLRPGAVTMLQIRTLRQAAPRRAAIWGC